jgi:hypothetical protein
MIFRISFRNEWQNIRKSDNYFKFIGLGFYNLCSYKRIEITFLGLSLLIHCDKNEP